MSNEKQKTVADISKEMRGITFGEECCPDCGADFQRSNRWIEFADRIEAAHLREVGELCGERNGILNANASLAADNDRLRREVAELRACLEQAYGDKIGTYTMKGNEVERWRNALREKGGAK